MNADAEISQEKDKQTQMDEKKAKYKRQRNAVIIAVIFFAVIVIVTVVQQKFSGKKYEDAVKNASPVEYQDQTYGQAFEQYFQDGSWSVFQQQDKSYIIQFQGVCTYQGDTDYALLQFMTGDVPAASASSGEEAAQAESSSSSAGTAVTVSPIPSTDDVHIIYIGLNEHALDESEQEAFLKDIFSGKE